MPTSRPPAILPSHARLLTAPTIVAFLARSLAVNPSVTSSSLARLPTTPFASRSTRLSSGPRWTRRPPRTRSHYLLPPPKHVQKQSLHDHHRHSHRRQTHVYWSGLARRNATTTFARVPATSGSTSTTTNTRRIERRERTTNSPLPFTTHSRRHTHTSTRVSSLGPYIDDMPSRR